MRPERIGTPVPSRPAIPFINGQSAKFSAFPVSGYHPSPKAKAELSHELLSKWSKERGVGPAPFPGYDDQRGGEEGKKGDEAGEQIGAAIGDENFPRI
jgi:hypothetical protein